LVTRALGRGAGNEDLGWQILAAALADSLLTPMNLKPGVRQPLEDLLGVFWPRGRLTDVEVPGLAVIVVEAIRNLSGQVAATPLLVLAPPNHVVLLATFAAESQRGKRPLALRLWNVMLALQCDMPLGL
jgi:hypothetical protein